MSALATTLRSHAGIAPAALVIAALMAVPLLIILVYSFLDASPFGGVRWDFTAEAYRRLLFEEDWDGNLVFNPAYLWIGARTVWVSLVAVLGSLLVGLPEAYYIALQPRARRNLLLLLVTLPFWTNLLIRTYAWILVLRDTGLVNGALLSTGLVTEPVTLLYTEGAIILGLNYTQVPFMILPVYAALERLDGRLIEAARDLFASKWATVRLVTLPLAMPGIVAGSILVFIPSLGSFLAPELLGGGQNLMLGSLVQLQFSSARNWPFGSAVAMVVMAIVLLSLLVLARNARRGEAGMLH